MKVGLAARAALAAWSVAAATAAHAQARPPVGTAGNPLQALPQIRTPQPSSNVTVQVQKQTSALVQLLATPIKPTRFQVAGVKSIPFDEVAKRFTPFAGKEVTIGQIVDAANGVTQMYKSRGYALSFAFVPKQDFRDGVVKITVVEGYVSDMKIHGDAGSLEPRIRAIAAHIAAERPLRQTTFQRYVNIFGLLPGVQVAANVALPQNTNGATTLDLTVTRKRVNVASGIDFNHPGLLAMLTATENGLTPLGEQLSVSTIAPRGRDNVAYLAAHGMVPIGSDGLSANVDASHYRSNPVDNPGLPSYVERTVVSDKLSAGLAYPFILDDKRSLVGRANVYAAHDEDHYQNMINSAMYGLRSQVRVLQLQADYTAVSTGEVRKASASVSKAFNILGASKNVDTNIIGTSLNDPTSLTFVKTNVSYMQADDWPYGFGTVVAMTAQYSPASLPTSEQIAFGAQHFAQGYEPGEASGDSGWGASIELNHAFRPGHKWLQTLTPYVAFDMARVYLHAGTPLPSRLSSASLGFRISDAKHYSLDLSVAKALGDAPIESSSRSPRVNATFSYQLN
jgi:hemolysin activation/secretion protein